MRAIIIFGSRGNGTFAAGDTAGLNGYFIYIFSNDNLCGRTPDDRHAARCPVQLSSAVISERSRRAVGIDKGFRLSGTWFPPSAIIVRHGLSAAAL